MYAHLAFLRIAFALFLDDLYNSSVFWGGVVFVLQMEPNAFSYCFVVSTRPPDVVRPLDIKHDVLEGILPNLILAILKHFNSNGTILIQEFNSNLGQLKIGKNNKS